MDVKLSLPNRRRDRQQLQTDVHSGRFQLHYAPNMMQCGTEVGGMLWLVRTVVTCGK